MGQFGGFDALADDGRNPQSVECRVAGDDVDQRRQRLSVDASVVSDGHRVEEAFGVVDESRPTLQLAVGASGDRRVALDQFAQGGHVDVAPPGRLQETQKGDARKVQRRQDVEQQIGLF